MACICKEKRLQGQITVFVSLIMSMVLCVTSALMEGARYNTVSMMAAMITDCAVDSVFSEYHRALLERYDLFFLDGSYDTAVFSEENIQKKVKEFASYMIEPTKGLQTYSGWRKNTDLWNMTLSEVKVKRVVLATDQNGTAFREQAIAFMQGKVAGDLLQQLLHWTGNTDSIEELERDLRQREEQSRKEIEKQELAQKENDANMSDVPAVGVERPETNPIEVIKEIKEKGILVLVAPELELGTTPVNVQLFPSNRSLNEGNYKNQLEQSLTAADRVLFHEYFFEKFSTAISSPENGSAADKKAGTLSCQLEYLIAGKASDIENVRSVVHQLLILREVVNFSYLVSDARKCVEAEAVAYMIAGVTGLPLLVQALKYGVLLAWAYGESIVDVKSLLDGQRVPILKTKDTWALELDNIGQFVEGTVQKTEEDTSGLSYQDYLRILLFLEKEDTLTMRALDMIEMDMRSLEGNEGFLVDHLVEEGVIMCKFETKTIFSGIMKGTDRQVPGMTVENPFSYRE